jgi:hypothetical protein
VIFRDRIARFIQEQGHRVEIARVGDADELSELVFRTRGQTFSLAISEMEPERFSLSTAYEVPDNVRDAAQVRDALKELEGDDPEVRFTLAHDDTIFIITLESRTTGVDALLEGFWEIVGRVRQSGSTAVERMLDRTESKAAADKFIRQFMKGSR